MQIRKLVAKLSVISGLFSAVSFGIIVLCRVGTTGVVGWCHCQFTVPHRNQAGAKKIPRDANGVSGSLTLTTDAARYWQHVFPC